MKKMVMILMLGAIAVLAEQVPVEVQQVIDNALSGKEFNQRVINFIRECRSYGFDSGSTLADIKAGTPFHLYTIDSDSLKNLTESTSVKSFIKPLNQWAVPLIQHGKPLACWLIAKTTGNPNWHIAGHGFTHWAQAWAKVSKMWPENKGYHPIYVGSGGLGPDYFYIPEKGDNNLSHLFHYGAQQNNSDSLYAALESASVVLKKLKSNMQSNLKGGLSK